MFFVKGRVFAVVWHESSGIAARSNFTQTSEQLDNPFHRHTSLTEGEVIFSHIRRFVVVKTKARQGYCLAVPINSYRHRGLTTKGMRMEEKQAHAIIYASGNQPIQISGEPQLNKEPIAVRMAHGETLPPSSRIHFGKPQIIEWNIKVRNVGLISEGSHLRRLIVYFRQENRSAENTD